MTPIADAGGDATSPLPRTDAGFDASPDATLLDGAVLDDASTRIDAADASPDVPADASADAAAGPEILSLSESVSAITQGDSFTVTAVVTDPQGLSDLAGGELTSASGSVIGAFTSSTPGTYSLTLSWAQLNAAAPINFTGQTTVTDRATFYDAQGLQASKDISIGLYCASDAGPSTACSGQCADLTSVANCGACAASCVDAGGPEGGASCASPGTCGWTTQVPLAEPSGTCASECAKGGGTCVAAQTTPEYSATAISETCSASPSSIGGSIQVTTEAYEIFCACGPNTQADAVNKAQGDCASACASAPGSPPCYGTGLYVASGAYDYEALDTCSAPYVVGIGNEWDSVVQADLPANETVLSPPGAIICHCQADAH